MIPRIIHYCWFGTSSMPQKHINNIEKWRKILSNYEFKCWNEALIDINSIPFLKEAYDNKMWAFVADYVRIYALYTEGGIYLDTDVNLLKTFDPYLNCSMFTSYEYHPSYKHMPIIASMIDEYGYRRKHIDVTKKIPGVGLMSAIIGSKPQISFMRELLDFYNNMDFIESRKRDYTIPTTLVIIAERYGFRYINEKQELKDKIIIYPSNIFADYRTKDSNTVAIHECAGSWANKKGIINKLRYFVWHKFYRIDIIRKIYMKVRNIFVEYPVYY